jgi:hypothetical protein
MIQIIMYALTEHVWDSEVNLLALEFREGKRSQNLTGAHFNNYVSGYYQSSYLLLKTHRFGDWNLSPSSRGTYLVEDRDQLYLLSPTEKFQLEDGDRIQSPKRLLNKIQHTL